MEGSPGTTTTRGGDSDEMDVRTALSRADNRRPGSSLLEVSTSKQDSSPPPVDDRSRQSTPPSSSTDKEEKCKVEDDDHEMNVEMNDDEDDVTIVPPITTNPNPVVKPEAEQQEKTDESRYFKEEQEAQSDLEIRRQRQRQALRGPTPSSSPQTRSRKTSLVVSKTGVKRDREEYEEGQVDDEAEDDKDYDEPGIIIEEKLKDSPVHGSISTETQAIPTDEDEGDTSEREIMIVDRKDDNPKRQKDKKHSTDGPGRQAIPQTEIKRIPTMSTGKGPNPKALGKRPHYRDFISPPISLTSLRSFVTTTTTTQQQQHQQSTTSLPPPSPQPRLPKKLGINHMDLLYKTEREVMVCRICL